MSRTSNTVRRYLGGPGLGSEFTHLHSHPSQLIAPRRFVTIARQVGAGGEAVPQRLVEFLNAQYQAEAPAWTAWDRELLEKAAADHHIPVELVAKIERSHYSFFDSFISGLGELPDEMALLHRVAESVRALAGVGHVVLVGHGSVFMTYNMPGGVHIRLVAPVSRRVEDAARRMRLPAHEALRQLKLLEQTRRAFMRRYWPAQSMAPETFTATFNTGLMDEDHLVRCIVALVA